MNYIEREIANKKKWTDAFGAITDSSGIYILRRGDEDGIKYAYIGQSNHILTRLGQHLDGYQHIDLSLKKHGLYSPDNRTGWHLDVFNFPIEELDDMERHYIKFCAERGYQLRNKTAGGQDKGKSTASRPTSPQKATTTAWRKARKTQRKSWQHSLKNISMPTSKVSRTKSKNAS